MALVPLADTKEYLRVDTADEDTVIRTFLSTAEALCSDIARLSREEWQVIDSDCEHTDLYSDEELRAIRETMRVAILYTVGYLFEHREDADHHALTMTLRSLLFAIREGVV